VHKKVPEVLTLLNIWHVQNALIFAKYAGFYSSKTPKFIRSPSKKLQQQFAYLVGA